MLHHLEQIRVISIFLWMDKDNNPCVYFGGEGQELSGQNKCEPCPRGTLPELVKTVIRSTWEPIRALSYTV